MRSKFVETGLIALLVAVSLVLSEGTPVRADRLEGVRSLRTDRVRPPRPNQGNKKAVPIPVLVPGMIALGIGLARKRKLQNSN